MATQADDILSQTLRINETFFSIQGESTWAGCPCFFIRLTGCPLRARAWLTPSGSRGKVSPASRATRRSSSSKSARVKSVPREIRAAAQSKRAVEKRSARFTRRGRVLATKTTACEVSVTGSGAGGWRASASARPARR